MSPRHNPGDNPPWYQMALFLFGMEIVIAVIYAPRLQSTRGDKAAALSLIFVAVFGLKWWKAYQECSTAWFLVNVGICLVSGLIFLRLNHDKNEKW